MNTQERLVGWSVDFCSLDPPRWFPPEMAISHPPTRRLVWQIMRRSPGSRGRPTTISEYNWWLQRTFWKHWLWLWLAEYSD